MRERRSSARRSRSLPRSLSNTSASTAASGVSTASRRARFHEGSREFRESNISNTSASTAASGSSSFKRKRSARGRSSRRSSEQDLSGLEGGETENEEGKGHSPEPASTVAQQLAQEHFWQHKSKFEGRLCAENKQKAKLLRKDPLHFARRPTDTDGLSYGLEHVEAHVTENLETKRKQEETLPEALPRGMSGRSSQLVEGWLTFVEKEEAAKKIQVAWRHSWRRRHGIPSPLHLSSDSEDERPARGRVQKRSSTMKARMQQPRRSITIGDRARRGSTLGEVTKGAISSKPGEDSVLPGRKSVVFDESSMEPSRLKEPSKSTDVSKPPGLVRSMTQARRSSMPGILRPSPSRSDSAANAKRVQQQEQQQRQQQQEQQQQRQQQQQEQQEQQEQQQQQQEQQQEQDSVHTGVFPQQAWRPEMWQEEQRKSSEDRPLGRVSLSLAVACEDMPSAFRTSQAMRSSDGSNEMDSPPRLIGQRQRGAPVQVASPHKRSAAAATAGVDSSHAGGREEGHAAGTAPQPLVTDRDFLLAELADQQGSASGRPHSRARSPHLLGEKGGQPWGYVLRAQPQPIQRPVSRLSVESSSASPQLPRGKSALSLLAVQGSKPPAPGAQHSPSHLTLPRSLPQLYTSLSSPTGGPLEPVGSLATNPNHTHTNAHSPTINSMHINSTHASFDVSEPSSPSRPLPGCLTAFTLGHPLQPTSTPQLPTRHSATVAHTSAYTPHSGHSMEHTAFMPGQPLQPSSTPQLPTRSPTTAANTHALNSDPHPLPVDPRAPQQQSQQSQHSQGNQPKGQHGLAMLRTRSRSSCGLHDASTASNTSAGSVGGSVTSPTAASPTAAEQLPKVTLGSITSPTAASPTAAAEPLKAESLKTAAGSAAGSVTSPTAAELSPTAAFGSAAPASSPAAASSTAVEVSNPHSLIVVGGGDHSSPPAHRHGHARTIMQLRTAGRNLQMLHQQQHHQQQQPQQQRFQQQSQQQQQQQQLLEPRRSLPVLEGDAPQGFHAHGLVSQRRKSLGVTNAELHLHAPKPPVGPPSTDQSFRGRMLEHKHLSKSRKHVPSPSSPSSLESRDSATSSPLGLQGRRFSSMLR